MRVKVGGIHTWRTPRRLELLHGRKHAEAATNGFAGPTAATAESARYDGNVLGLATAPELRVREALLADVPDLARVRVASWERAYRGILPDNELARVTPRGSAIMFGRALEGRKLGHRVLVLEREGTICGYATIGPSYDRMLSFRGEVYELYIHPRFQGRGGGKVLLNSSLWQLVDLGFNPAMLWVLEGNPAQYFYEACGGVRIGRRPLRFAGSSGWKIAYGWKEVLPIPRLAS